MSASDAPLRSASDARRSASEAPLRGAGLRTRSGNAMARTRAAILEAAAACVEQVGARRTTMSQVAATGGVAKATLYNHFRTKDDVLAALVEARVAAAVEQCQGRAPADALELAAAALRNDPALRRVAQEEPALLVPLAVPGDGRPWAQLRAGLTQVLGGPEQVELVLRWLLSQLLWPAAPGAGAAVAGALAAGASAGPAEGTPRTSAHPSGLGWPDGPARLRTR